MSVQYLLKQGDRKTKSFQGVCKSGKAQISGAQIFKVLMQNIRHLYYAFDWEPSEQLPWWRTPESSLPRC